MDTSEERRLVGEAITAGFFGSDPLSDTEAQLVPQDYRLVREIGRGGAGTVYLARDLRLDRDVALKFLSDARRVDLERFRREARFTARLADPAIVQIYELGEIEGQPFIAMQFVDGGNLAEADLDHYSLIAALRPVVVALGHAHQQCIVHRDIKPENILVDRRGRAFLTDFGIARDMCAAEGQTISRDGQIMGTPALMPPEQARGDQHAIDARSDLYSFGATLYCAATGRRPFEGNNVVDVLHAVIHDDPVYPRTHDASVPRPLEAVILKCLRKDKRERYQNAADLLADLDNCTQGRVVGAEGLWFRRLVSKLVGAPKAAAVPPPLPADTNPGESIEIVRELAAWDANLYRTSGSLAAAFARLDELTARLERIMAERPDTAWARFHRGMALFRRGRLGEAVEEMERSVDRVPDPAGAYHELGRTYLALFLRAHRKARQHLAPTGKDHEVTVARRYLDQAVIAFQEAQRLQGNLPAWQAEYCRAVARLGEGDPDGCVRACDAIVAREPDLEEVWKLRGDALALAGSDPTEAYDRALDIRRTYFEVCYAKAEYHVGLGRLKEARACLAQALRIHSEFGEALVLEARTWLLEAREHGDRTLVERGLACTLRALDLEPTHDVFVTRAELALEIEDTATALAMLERAKGTEGCQNRVQLLTARALLTEAGRGGEGAARSLQSARALCEEAAAANEGSGAWQEVRLAVQRLLDAGASD